MKRRLVVGLPLVAALVPLAAPSFASDIVEPDATILRPVHRSVPAPGGAGHATANSNCAGAECDTVWVGHSSSGPGGAFLGVGVGGVWDFDTGIAGTDSSQGWRTWVLPYRVGGSRPPLSRPEWALDYGNSINAGNTVLWAARDLAGRKYVRTGVAGAWHSDTMVGVKSNVANEAEPSALPIAGSRSAWCGLREDGNLAAQDALTGNYLNGALQIDLNAQGFLPEFPGFCNLWDQMMYKDFPSTGSGTVGFRFRTDMSTAIDNFTPSGWFNPDPTNISHFVNNPADTFMVYVGSPNETAYDTNRRWLSEVLDLTKPHQEIFAISGKRPVALPDSAVVKAFNGLQPVGGRVRVVFRVKTNRVFADQSTGSVGGFNAKDGAALVDDVQVDGGTIYGFESAGSLVGRSLIPDLSLDGGPWATTGKPPGSPFRIADVATLIYEDLCGAVGSPTRQCNLAGNVWTPQDATTGKVPLEGYWNVQSPTIDLAVRSAAPGTKNAQGIDQETASRTSVVVEFDFYSGFMDLDQSVFYFGGARAFAPATYFQPISHVPVWTGALYSFITFNPDPECYTDFQTLANLGVQAGTLDSVRILIAIRTEGWRFGGQDLGNTRGTYVDNLRLGFVRPSSPSLAQAIANKYQDQFPFNESVPPGDNAAFDTTTALMNTGLNIVAPATAPGVVAGDSILVTAPFVGDGVATGVRVDLIFRIDPGPGNYTVKGNRGSALVNRDPVHPFFATYLASNGPFGTPGGHGGTWNRHVWNSARMDSAELRFHPIVSRAIGGPVANTWMGTLHEQDPNYATLGIDRPLCFLVNPNGSTDDSNLSCNGTPPAIYGAVSGSSREATKILPDGWFSPGTHIEYFVRKSSLAAPGSYELLFDTTRVFPQGAGTPGVDFDQERWSSVDVLPDMWKSTRYGGRGLACLLMIDGADRRGADPQYRGSADTLGFGKDDGATSGWRSLGPGSDPNDPAGFVAANRGQYGWHYDHYDIRASESAEAGHPGVRFASNTGGIALKGDKSGPSAAMLAALYRTVLHFSGDLSGGILQDGFDAQEGADDIALYDGFLAGATPANRRGLWLSGDGIMEDGAINSDNGTFLYPFLTEVMGSDLVSTSYHAYAPTAATTVGFQPVAAWNNAGRIYGFNNVCSVLADVLSPVPTVDGAITAARYQAIGSGTEFTSSVYRPAANGRDFRTLIDGFDLSSLRGNYASLADIATQVGTNIGRLTWYEDVASGHFQLCRTGPWIGVGDMPGPQAARFTNQNLGAYPNPAFAARTVTLRFTLAAPQPVKVRIYNVAGREVASFEHKGVEGENRAPWDGRLTNGASAPAGVYFYRLDGVRFDGPDGGGGAKTKLILLSGGAR